MNDNWLKRSMMLRIAIIGCLTVLLMIPSFLVMGLVSEREQTRNSAIQDVSEKWGEQQIVSGPILTLPFRHTTRSGDGETRTLIEHANLLPVTMRFAASASPELRYRGIYEVVLYNAAAELQGTFSLDGLAALNIKAEDVLWDEASLTIGISDLKGVKEPVKVRWGGQEFTAEPGVRGANALGSGISFTPLASPKQVQYEFATKLNLNGSGELQFIPVGKETDVAVSSSWKSPSFVGRFLPDERTIGTDGFSAKWKVLHLNRNFPQQWVSERMPNDGANIPLSQSAFGVKLISPVDEYQQTMRSAKYAIMFIALTFLAFFLTEVLAKKTGHPVHYALIGFALVLFYCLLLSLSEHIPFTTAYSISAGAIVVLIGGYSRSVLGTTRFALIISSLVGLLYTFLYVILRAEDYALLFGSIGLFVVIALVMYLTRKVDWYMVGKIEKEA